MSNENGWVEVTRTMLVKPGHKGWFFVRIEKDGKEKKFIMKEVDEFRGEKTEVTL